MAIQYNTFLPKRYHLCSTVKIEAAFSKQRDLIMATRGVKQLQKLSIYYCEHGGSSQYVREFIRSGGIIKLAQENPTVEIICQVRPAKHPFIKGDYLTGYGKQVCVKNESFKIIRQTINRLLWSSGRKIKKFEKPVLTNTPSVQGMWAPMLDIAQQNWDIKLVDSKS